MENGITLKEYFERRLEDMDKATRVALAANDRRLDGMNEFRETLKDQTAQFALKREYDEVRKEVQQLREFKAELTGKASNQSVFISYVLSVIAIILSAIHLFRG